jgi:hypothetical protein
MRPRFLPLFLILCALAGGAACSSEPYAPDEDDSGEGGTGGTGGAGGAGGGTGGAPAACEATPIACSDQAFLDLNYQTEPAPGKIENAADGSGFFTTVDARAGGAFVSEPHSYVYARFTEAGLEKVELSDEASLDSMDWDIAFRRYVIRVNSGDSGPSCTSVARVPGMVNYDDVTSVPATLDFNTEDYYTADCTFIEDGSGLEKSPATTLSSYWQYPGCVQMTKRVFVVELRDRRRLKLTVSGYYSETAQEECDTTGSSSGNGSGMIRFRWAFLQ